METKLGLTLIAVLAIAVGPAFAQTSIGGDVLRDLPASANLSSVLETTQAEVVSDRFYTGGLNAAEAPRLGAFLGSWTQTLFRIGDVNITDPAGNGAPFLIPDVSFWESVDVATALMPPDVSASSLAVTLEPRRPTPAWMRSGEASYSGSGLVANRSGAGPPAIGRLNGWSHASALASGPLVPKRLGLVVAGSVTRASQFARDSTVDTDGTVASGLAHLVFTRDNEDEIRTVGWIQRVRAGQSRTSMHVQSTWERRASQRVGGRLFGSYSQRSATADSTLQSGAVIERLIDGPVPELVEIGGGTSRRWSIGGRAAWPAPMVWGRSQTLQAGIDAGNGSTRMKPGFQGAIGELVNGNQARVWNYSRAGMDSVRHETTIAAFFGDRINLTPRLVVDTALRFDDVSGAAEGAATGTGWRSWLPRVAIRWAATDLLGISLFGGYTRTADALGLNELAVGDPAAPVANVYRWEVGDIDERVARVGPGTGGDPSFSAIDTRLARPVTDEIALGIESRLTRSIRLRFSGIAKRQAHPIGIVNIGVPATSYSTIGIRDPGLDLAHADDDQVITVYDRLPASFGRDRYLLTNPAQDAATFEGLVFGADVSTDRLFLLFGATASQTNGPAANRGFHANENDVGVLGEVFTNPNAATFARGRVFFDRAYTMKVTIVYKLPADVRIGAIARYQDGQPFSRLVVVPGLGQGAEAIRAFPNGDSRFTFTGTLDLRLQKGFTIAGRRVDAIVDGYNVINRANEVEEDVVTGPAFRTVTAIQPPRAIHLGLRVAF